MNRSWLDMNNILCAAILYAIAWIWTANRCGSHMEPSTLLSNIAGSPFTLPFGFEVLFMTWLEQLFWNFKFLDSMCVSKLREKGIF